MGHTVIGGGPAVRSVGIERGFGLVGVHGGAGTTTVAFWLSAAEPQRVQVTELGSGGTLLAGWTPLVVARYTAYGTLQAARYLESWPTNLPRPWLVLVRDAPLPPPKPAVFRRRAVGARVLGVSQVPYLPQLRAVDSPEDGLRLRPVAQAAGRLRAELGV